MSNLEDAWPLGEGRRFTVEPENEGRREGAEERGEEGKEGKMDHKIQLRRFCFQNDSKFD